MHNRDSDLAGNSRVLVVEGGERVPLWCAGAELYGGVRWLEVVASWGRNGETNELICNSAVAVECCTRVFRAVRACRM